ncbi:MAG: hypothetical protein ACLR6O_05225 [Eubacterium sp.]
MRDLLAMPKKAIMPSFVFAANMEWCSKNAEELNAPIISNCGGQIKAVTA